MAEALVPSSASGSSSLPPLEEFTLHTSVPGVEPQTGAGLFETRAPRTRECFS